ncbi:hypothetical protein Cgig2_028276 [Carnegiea gigantea]|uniref:Uncharacterized protein n=1 Tax=Carnegiea gigantea TaxID=171969 RepID=A0A9Q1GN50_9CARY|nr:hypothetical protein Cgig2_028276 [Carnegiea gigantea]
MAEICDIMLAEYDFEPGNEVNDKARGQGGVTITYKRKVKMAQGGFLNLVERLDYEQWSTIMETWFGGILAVRTRLLFYLDRVEFKADKVERWFPILINWPTKKVKKRDRDEQLPGEDGRGRIIERLDYQNVKCLAEVDLQQYLKELDEVQDQQGISTKPSITAAAKERQSPHCPHYKGKFQCIVPVHDEPTEKGKAWALGKTRNPELSILKDQVDELERMAREKI